MTLSTFLFFSILQALRSTSKPRLSLIFRATPKASLTFRFAPKNCPHFQIHSQVSIENIRMLFPSWIGGENHRPAASHWHILSHKIVSSTPRHGWESNSELYQLQALTAYVAVNPTLNIIRPRSSSIETVLIQKQKSSEHEGREAPIAVTGIEYRSLF